MKKAPALPVAPDLSRLTVRQLAAEASAIGLDFVNDELRRRTAERIPLDADRNGLS